jgi:hypothetical protein
MDEEEAAARRSAARMEATPRRTAQRGEGDTVGGGEVIWVAPKADEADNQKRMDSATVG